jgi:3-hydroxyacyl-CoA dehydrogenase / enoyl-CoA hydratase / 3-hydroxybutyryl-CoA epimerase
MAKVVETKKLGKKNRSGFYLYDDKGKKLSVDPSIYNALGLPAPKNALKDEELVHRCLFPMINEAAICLAEGIAGDAQTVDLGMIMGTGFPPFRGGLLRWADSLGSQKIVDELSLMVGKYGRRFTPSAPLREMAKTNKTFYGR